MQGLRHWFTSPLRWTHWRTRVRHLTRDARSLATVSYADKADVRQMRSYVRLEPDKRQLTVNLALFSLSLP